MIIARTDGLSAVDAPEPARGLDLAIERALRYLDTGIPDLVWCEFPTSDRGPVETFATRVRDRFPDARFAFNWSSSFKWFNDPTPITFAELGELGFKFIFITLGGQHAMGYGLTDAADRMARARSRATSRCSDASGRRARTSRPAATTCSAACPYHHLVGRAYDAARWARVRRRSSPKTASSEGPARD